MKEDEDPQNIFKPMNEKWPGERAGEDRTGLCTRRSCCCCWSWRSCWNMSCCAGSSKQDIEHSGEFQVFLLIDQIKQQTYSGSVMTYFKVFNMFPCDLRISQCKTKSHHPHRQHLSCYQSRKYCSQISKLTNKTKRFECVTYLYSPVLLNKICFNSFTHSEPP